ncbi:SDR family NAD(P)-dependent oxidoreductase [Roseibium album]|uniref:3-oxoacyl-[acyl-carrier-protein] reductase FabG n=1 Tax=Roseibium album TaxID=311410 RepID=A0A0M7A631_9HYPH|nr:SDR family NAD(P)-dependent oxidoreductase [Roseibium album]MBG6147168.1 3-oxoacyl-[acyl-carrier protein] reductase [Labrenzia sp. EL_142]CTQ63247.1 3-oxoacyl-[acyl-carrier-protein] reductase FabG [Roseibium album]CTQ69084.1 3-oxoacyl-[acyl-carrier-protein] reductase FabG [Roseibium album]CTQ80810.1 3-oxoacyl-[acyl-carrier-protein] reductase FabG [Roseibium album]
MNRYDFNQRVAIVTGGAQGIGWAVAKTLAEGGARVAIWDMDQDLAVKAAHSLGEGAQAVSVNIADWESVEAAYAQTRNKLGPVDIVVNSAGIAGSNSPVADYCVKEFHDIVAVNLLGTFHVNKVAVPDMQARDYGRIVNIASVAGKEGNPNAAAYSSSKAGVIGFTKSLGKELAGGNIAVNCVTPAAARTRIFDQMSQEHIDYMLSKIPRGRFLEVEEAAHMIAWLASSENSFTTAGVFDLSGGRATY